MEKNKTSSVREPNQLIIPEAYIIDSLKERKTTLFDLPELRLPDSYRDYEDKPVSFETTVIVIEL